MAVDRTLVIKLRPMAVKQYAESNGWEPVLIEGVRFWLFRHTEKNLRQLQIPMDADDAGFGDAMLDVVRRLSEIEQRTEEAVIADLQWPDADILRVRVVSHDTEVGQLSLADDVELREGVRRAILASACSVINPVRYHPRMSRSEAEALLTACRAGQTERGSYVVKIICPLYAVELPDDQTVPFTRKVTTYLMRSTANLVDNIEHDRFEYADDPSAPLSWNLCDALLRMRPDRDAGQIELTAHWATDRRLAPPAELPARVAIKAEYFREIEQIARTLRSGYSEAREQQLIGTVEQLSGVVGDDNRRAGEVQFTLLEDNEQVRAKAILTAEQYEVAMRAHQRGDTYIVLRGILHRGRRMSRIDPIRTLDLVDDGSEM